ncbi:MAG: hypothetical protein JJE42_19355 [Burkholderiales bacterium]|nr:hypothetical protein [Burkholderiales bacterium]
MVEVRFFAVQVRFWGVKRTSQTWFATSAFDPQRKSSERELVGGDGDPTAVAGTPGKIRTSWTLGRQIGGAFVAQTKGLAGLALMPVLFVR